MSIDHQAQADAAARESERRGDLAPLVRRIEALERQYTKVVVVPAASTPEEARERRALIDAQTGIFEPADRIPAAAASAGTPEPVSMSEGAAAGVSLPDDRNFGKGPRAMAEAMQAIPSDKTGEFGISVERDGVHVRRGMTSITVDTSIGPVGIDLSKGAADAPSSDAGAATSLDEPTCNHSRGLWKTDRSSPTNPYRYCTICERSPSAATASPDALQGLPDKPALLSVTGDVAGWGNAWARRCLAAESRIREQAETIAKMECDLMNATSERDFRPTFRQACDVIYAFANDQAHYVQQRDALSAVLSKSVPSPREGAECEPTYGGVPIVVSEGHQGARSGNAVTIVSAPPPAPPAERPSERHSLPSPLAYGERVATEWGEEWRQHALSQERAVADLREKLAAAERSRSCDEAQYRDVEEQNNALASQVAALEAERDELREEGESLVRRSKALLDDAQYDINVQRSRAESAETERDEYRGLYSRERDAATATVAKVEKERDDCKRMWLHTEERLGACEVERVQAKADLASLRSQAKGMVTREAAESACRYYGNHFNKLLPGEAVDAAIRDAAAQSASGPGTEAHG